MKRPDLIAIILIGIFILCLQCITNAQDCCQFDIIRHDTVLRQSSISVIEVPPGKHATIRFEDNVVITNSLDNTNPAITFSGSWYNGATTAAGFSNNTMAYSNIIGNSLTYQFSGTSIEVFCEKKVGHGRASFQLDSNPAVTINLGVTGGVGLVFGAYTLNEGTHTFKLTVLDNKYVVFDGIRTSN